jgi:gluconate transporter
MSFIIVLAGIILLLILIACKFNPVIALLTVSVVTGLLLKIPVAKLMSAISTGIGNTLGGLAMVLALGAMLGKLVQESGAAQTIVKVLVGAFHKRHIQWAVLLTGITIGIPLFYDAGFVVLIPLVFSIAASTRLPVLYIGIPMAASLSVMHGFLPPHPGPMTLATIFHANVGKVLLYGFLIGIPTAMVAGVFFTRLIIKPKHIEIDLIVETKEVGELPSAGKSFFIALLPVLLITIGTVGLNLFKSTTAQPLFLFLQDPTIALLIAVLMAIVILGIPIAKAMAYCTDGVRSIALIVFIIAAGGAFKQILIESGVGQQIADQAAIMHVQPLVLGWLIAALLRVTLGSATIAALTTSGIVLPLIKTGVSPELMVLSVGAGSLFCSHVNDTGFWMFKEYFKLTAKQTFTTWTIVESLISVLGLGGVLLLNGIGI